MDRFFLGPNRTALVPGEMIREVYFPEPVAKAKMVYHKMGLRNAMAISVVSLAVVFEMKEGICRQARIGLGAVAPRPIRAYETEKIMTGQSLSEEDLGVCGRQVENEVSPIEDIRASAEYRRMMASVLLQRIVREALEKGK